MKKNTATIIADQKAINYFCLLKPVQAKKVLFTMDLLRGDQRLGDSNIAEARHIAGLYDGVISANYAKELASKLVSEYAKRYPGILLTKKKLEAYTHAKYRSLYDIFGLYGFDYVVTAAALAKAHVANPANGIDEKHMLNALRWEERREDVDPVTSNDRHRRKAIQLMGMGDMTEALLPHTFLIASIYELVAPGAQNVSVTESIEDESHDEDVQLTKADMVAAFIDNAHLLKDFFGTPKPEVPKGFFEDELYEGSRTHSLAVQGMFNDSEVVLKYVEGVKMYESCQKRIAEVFSEAEIRLVNEKAETIQEILRLVDSL